MKKIFLLVFSIFSLSYANAQTKNVDLDVTMVYPKNTGGSDEIWSYKSTQIDVVVKNVGNTTLTSDNTFYYGFELDGKLMTVKEKHFDVFPPTYTIDSIYYGTGITLTPGDTFHIFKGIIFGFPEVMNGYHSFCLFLVPDTVTNLFKDVNRSNNAGCTNIKLYGGWPSAIDEVSGLGNTLSFVPNPAYNEVSTDIVLAHNKNVSLQVMDLSGRLVAEKDYGQLNAGHQQLTISVASLPQGFYISQLIVGENVYSGKLVVSR